MSFGGEAEAGVNFYLGSSAGVVVKKSWFVDQNMKSGAIGFGGFDLCVKITKKCCDFTYKWIKMVTTEDAGGKNL